MRRSLLFTLGVLIASITPTTNAVAEQLTQVRITAPPFVTPDQFNTGVTVTVEVSPVQRPVAGETTVPPSFVPLPAMQVEVSILGVTKSGFTTQSSPAPQPTSFSATFKSNEFASPPKRGPIAITAVAFKSAELVSNSTPAGLTATATASFFYDAPSSVPGLVMDLDSGANHTCALITDTGVRCWGAGEQGQIGNGALVDVDRATAVRTASGTLSEVKAIDVGMNHACALVGEEGEVWCWGANSGGQLGVGTSGAPSNIAVKTPISNAVDVAAGNEHSCAVLSNSTVRCWGRAGAPFLGGSSTTTPVKLSTAQPLTGAVEVAAGQVHTCIRLASGSVTCFGTSTFDRLGGGSASKEEYPRLVPGLTGALEIEAGRAHTCARTTSSAVCWGFNLNGQLGRGDTTTAPAAATLAAAPSAMSLGASHSCFVVADSTVCSGRNGNGQFGTGDTANSLAPLVVPLAARSVQLSAGDNHSCFLGPATPVAFVRCSGSNAEGQLGDGTFTDRLTPVRTGGMTGVAEIATGGSHTCALLVGGGGLRCWGANANGQLGDGTTIRRSVPTGPPSSSAPPANAFGIEAGGSHSCLLAGVAGDSTGDQLYCWGRNTSGQLGLGSTSDVHVPTLVGGVTPLSLALGDNHTCAVMPAASGQRRSIRCWGANGSGQLGDGTTTDRSVPTPVTGLTGTQPQNIVSLSAGSEHTCAVLDDGSLRCWGSNSSLQLGTTSVSLSKTPREAEFIAGATGVETGADFTCVIASDGEAQCFGANGDLQLGYPGSSSSFPVSTSGGVSSVKRLSATGRHICAWVDGAFTLNCWGSNDRGQIGNGSQDDSPDGTDAISGIVLDGEAGGSHTCAVLLDATVRCYGANDAGQLGDGGTEDALLPVTVTIS